MAKTADRASSDGLAPREVGRQLRHVRRTQGLSRSEVARSAGLTRRELAAYERGRSEVPESDLWCLAGSCGVDVSELLPNRTPVEVSSDLSLLAVGDSVRYLRDPVEDDDEMLREYLAMIYELRNLPPGSRIPVREHDLMSLADALGGTPERIEARLVELIGMSHQEAARLRAMIIPGPPQLSAPAAADPDEEGDADADAMPGPVDATNPYSQLPTGGDRADDSDVIDFFSGPRAIDVFEPPPPPDDLSTTNGRHNEVETPAYAPVDPVTPVAGPGVDPETYEVPIAPLGDPAAALAPVDPFAAPEPTAFTPEPATPASQLGYLVDEPVAPGWPVLRPTEPSAFDGPTVDWGMDAPPTSPLLFDGELAPMFPSAPVAGAPDEPWLDADPLPRRLPLSSAAVEPQAPLAEPWSAPLAAPEPQEVYEVPLPAPAPERQEVYEMPPPIPAPAAPEAYEMPPPIPAPAAPEAYEMPLPIPAPAAPEAYEVPLPIPAPAAPEAYEMAPPIPAPASPQAYEMPLSAPAPEVVFAPPAPRAYEMPPPVHAPAPPAPPMAYEVPLAVQAPAPPVLPAAYEVPLPVRAPEVLAAPTTYPIPAPPVPPVPPLPAPPLAPFVRNEITNPEPAPAVAAIPGPTFERAGSNWRVGGIFPATATADDGALALRRADARWALADVNAPGDFTLETAVDFTAGAGFGVLFRATVDDNDRVSGYSFDIDPIAGGGGYLVRQWEDNRQHWRPLAQSSVPDPTLLFGRHTLSVSLRADQLTAVVDGDTVLSVPALSRCSIELGREPCRGPHIGIQAWATTEVTIDSFRVTRS